MKLGAKIKIKRSKRVVFKEINGVVYILDPRDSTVYTLNEIASFIWQLLKTSRSTKELISLIIDNFDVEKERAKADLENFISQCSEDRLIVEI